MADNSVYTPAYRGYAFSSTNNKEDIIATELQHFRIALQIMAGHPEVLSEFKRKVKSDGKSDSTTYQKNQNDIRAPAL